MSYFLWMNLYVEHTRSHDHPQLGSIELKWWCFDATSKPNFYEQVRVNVKANAHGSNFGLYWNQNL